MRKSIREHFKEVAGGLGIPEKQLGEEELIDLWKYFEDRVEQIKQSMITITTWLLAFAGALLGFTVTKLKVLDATSGVHWGIILVLCLIGLAICIYVEFLLREFGSHMRRNWNTAYTLIVKIKPLLDIRSLITDKTKTWDQSESKKLPKVCRYIRTVVIVFGVLFCCTIIVALICK